MDGDTKPTYNERPTLSDSNI
ncbi:hypothetical protein CCACVL1_07981 [Corchorus capsularis]|uniref:Uncharacterized protein n=1 Tax=Corchorus capsularis TaxID=210143 RepID=A0A1R3J312_COCAP|nr:hypothetical protein CCACVL1_07981 [Corchorus capsularis]